MCAGGVYRCLTTHWQQKRQVHDAQGLIGAGVCRATLSAAPCLMAHLQLKAQQGQWAVDLGVACVQGDSAPLCLMAHCNPNEKNGVVAGLLERWLAFGLGWLCEHQ